MEKENRLKIYEQALLVVLEDKKMGNPCFLCPTIGHLINVFMGCKSTYAADPLEHGFEELFNHRPVGIRETDSWFGMFEYKPRIKILKAIIKEMKEADKIA